jgi:hypothetical protein
MTQGTHPLTGNTQDNPFCRMPDATETYILENQYVSSLEVRIIGNRSKLRTNNALVRAVWNLARTVKSVLKYGAELVTCRELTGRLRALKNSRSAGKALVIGNGPSQGYLKVEFLRAFKLTGGDVFVVNFWNQNRSFEGFVPDYLVISDPATLCFDDGLKALHEKNTSLLNYLKGNTRIKVICPFPRCSEISHLLGPDRVIGFTDTEMPRFTGNINPMYPRGYLSMTLFKALAMAIYFGYRNIYVIGMDNTYPRNIYCDEKNRILNLERHSGVADSVADQSSIYACVGDLLKELATQFLDAKKFAAGGAVKNLDRYSLTDAFPKVKFEEAIGDEIPDIPLMIHERLSRYPS